MSDNFFISFYFFFLFAYSGIFININDCFLAKLRGDIALDLVGMPSSNFPGSSMLNYILYGTSDAGFSYKDFLNHYGYKVDYFPYGTVIIGNDGMLGGMYFWLGEIVLPIKSQQIQLIKEDDLPKYFPNGYTILRNDNQFDNKPYSGNMSGKAGDYVICSSCNVDLLNYKDSDLFSLYTLFSLYQGEKLYDPYINLYGYIENYNTTNKSGIMKATFYDASSTLEFVPLNIDNNNSVYFTIDKQSDLSFHGNISLNYNGSLLNYIFEGKMHPNK